MFRHIGQRVADAPGMVEWEVALSTGDVFNSTIECDSLTFEG